MTDFIGDIHGHADKLEELLIKLGYSLKSGAYRHPERKVVFVGDYIDRGPKIKETLHLVRSMVDAGAAIALMGNHEYNAICFHLHAKNGGHLRKHNIKNVVQHLETLKQFQNKQEEYNSYIDWFMTLPLYLETEHFRAVHACWDNENIRNLRSILNQDMFTEEIIYASADKQNFLYQIVDETLKGKEIKMPEGLSFFDKDGTQRSEIRIKWWEDPANATYKQMSVLPLEQLPERAVDLTLLKNSGYYHELEKPVFYGHYWLNGLPSLQRENICCLDYSVAKQGYLVSYRYDGESQLSSDKLVFV